MRVAPPRHLQHGTGKAGGQSHRHFLPADTTWGGGEYVERAVDERLEMIGNLNLFWQEGMAEDMILEERYDFAVGGAPLVFDMRRLSAGFQSAFVKAMNHQIERLCDLEAWSGRGAWPFVFCEEAHGYCTPATMTTSSPPVGTSTSRQSLSRTRPTFSIPASSARSTPCSP